MGGDATLATVTHIIVDEVIAYLENFFIGSIENETKNKLQSNFINRRFLFSHSGMTFKYPKIDF